MNMLIFCFILLMKCWLDFTSNYGLIYFLSGFTNLGGNLIAPKCNSEIAHCILFPFALLQLL